MSDDDHIDEVALNVLLAQGVDFPTALEASRIPAPDPSDADEATDPSVEPQRRAIDVILFVLVAIVMLLAYALL